MTIHSTATIDDDVVLGEDTHVWHYTHVGTAARVGRGCTLGQNVFIAPGVRLGDRVKLQNNVSVYEGVELADDVFCGPSCVFTNVINPRSEISRRGQYALTIVARGATIGANATIVCGSKIGRYAFVGAGAVVTRTTVVPDYARMLGVPAKQRGWVSRHGHTLPAPDADGFRRCPESGWRYRETTLGTLVCLDKDEEEAL